MKTILKNLCVAVSLVAACVTMQAGCESNSDDIGFSGSWSVSNGNSSLAVTFRDDGTWYISAASGSYYDNAYGTYSVSGSHISGSMYSSAGAGTMSATISGSHISLNLTNPNQYQTVSYTGVKAQ